MKQQAAFLYVLRMGGMWRASRPMHRCVRTAGIASRSARRALMFLVCWNRW